MIFQILAHSKNTLRPLPSHAYPVLLRRGNDIHAEGKYGAGPEKIPEKEEERPDASGFGNSILPLKYGVRAEQVRGPSHRFLSYFRS
jgi:hypothetical protein